MHNDVIYEYSELITNQGWNWQVDKCWHEEKLNHPRLKLLVLGCSPSECGKWLEENMSRHSDDNWQWYLQHNDEMTSKEDDWCGFLSRMISRDDYPADGRSKVDEQIGKQKLKGKEWPADWRDRWCWCGWWVDVGVSALDSDMCVWWVCWDNEL